MSEFATKNSGPAFCNSAGTDSAECLAGVLLNMVKYRFRELYTLRNLACLVDAPAEPLIPNLIPSRSIVLVHGQPRASKTLFAMEVQAALATGTPAFESSRLRVAAPVPTLHISAEDDPRQLVKRFKALLRSHGQTNYPENLYVELHSGFLLDEEDGLDQIARRCLQYGIRLVVLDCLRRLTVHADKGAGDFAPVAQALLAFRERTGATILLVHHDAKGGRRAVSRDELPNLASGGGVFSVADAPIHLRRLNDNRFRVTPALYKHMGTPDRFVAHAEFQAVGSRDAIRLTEHVSRARPAEGTLDERILARLLRGPVPSATALARDIHASKQGVLAAVDRLKAGGQVQSHAFGRSTMWSLVGKQFAPIERAGRAGWEEDQI